jgi:aryl-alcohol dehydrogenase-like predicted oxidoreductase/enamine deaminase RidA (YjgF/YER057c/UK114 family)
VPPAPPVHRCALAPGLSVSRVTTGLWQIADLERDGRSIDRTACAAAMAPYVDAGLTTFDMADHYGSAEEIAGLFAAGRSAGPRPELLTKWVPPPGPLSKSDVRAAVERSLRRLRMPALDLLQFHAWNYAHPSWLDALFWLGDLRNEGLVRHLGLTNFDAAHLRIVVESGIPVVSNQVCFSLLDDRPRRGGLPELCRKHGLKLLAYGTVAGGFLTERFLGQPEPDWGRLPTWSLLKYGRFIRGAGGWEPFQGLLRAVAAVARRHGVSMANVACRYVLEEPAVAGVIIGARLSASEHVADNRRLFAFALDAEDRRELEEARARLRPLPGDPGDEYRRPPFLTASGDLSHHLDTLPPPYAPRPGPGGRTLVLSGTEWEPLAGFCRALRMGDRILVSGTTATHRDRAIGGSDPAAQTHFVIDKIEGALQSLGGRLQDVVRTRVFVKRSADWEAVARAHGDRFREILPANTLVQADLVGNEYLVEIEAEAVVAPG